MTSHLSEESSAYAVLISLAPVSLLILQFSFSREREVIELGIQS